MAFNSVLINLYRDGNDSMGWHADDEKELGTDPAIASVSLGATRDLLLRYRQRNASIPNQRIALSDGSLLLMAGTTQHFWQHSLPKRKKSVTPRINLTFRYIHPAG
jgi:alkylated DNA repair dioxygenase AlkB